MRSFYDIYARFKGLDFTKVFDSISERDVERALAAKSLGTDDLLALISPAAGRCLEQMAGKAHMMTLKNFGRTIQLYTPMYVSDHCDNRCVYCSFSADNNFERKRLAEGQIDEEARLISATGLRHILLLTGESKKQSPVGYIKDCVRILRKHFDSISIEVYPLSERDYADLAEEGVDGLTIYQETYDEDMYRSVHPCGPKKDYRFRLDAPERGAKGRMRQVNIGALLGLSDWRKDVFFTGLHTRYLQDRYPDVEIGASVPRLRPHAGIFRGSCTVSDRDMVQIVLALRLFLPRLGISLSTREDPEFRDNLIGLGITRLSAGSITSVGGHSMITSKDDTLSQFEIADNRSVPEIMSMIRQKGYDPVLKDWMCLA